VGWGMCFPGLTAVPPSAWVALVSVVGLHRHRGSLGGIVAERPGISRVRPGPLGGSDLSRHFKAFPGVPGSLCVPRARGRVQRFPGIGRVLLGTPPPAALDTRWPLRSSRLRDFLPGRGRGAGTAEPLSLSRRFFWAAAPLVQAAAMAAG